MARQTRQQRRQRRATQQPQQPATVPATPRAAAAPADAVETRPAPRRAEQREERPGLPARSVRFVQESYAELKKVEWPDQKALVSGTAVVIIACLIVGAFLWLNDELWKYVVQHVLLR